MKTEFLIAASMATLFAGAATAQHNDRDEEAHATQRADVTARVAERFDRADTDADGILTKTEITAAREARRSARAERRDERFAKADANGDGRLDPDEFVELRSERVGGMFARLDKDGDGTLTKAELAEIRAGRDRRGGKRGRGFLGAGLMRLADANKDGNVSREEAETAALARFDRADANKDGVVTREERRAAMAEIKALKRR